MSYESFETVAVRNLSKTFMNWWAIHHELGSVYYVGYYI
jgi:hypothetical protein